MPEGPEVRTIAEWLDHNFASHHPILKNVEILENRQNYKGLSKLKNKKLIKVWSWGKGLFFEFENHTYLYVQLRLTGGFFLKESSNDRVIFHFTDPKKFPSLHFRDSRGFGIMKVFNEEELTEKLHSLGLDPFNEDFEIPNSLKKSRGSIVNILVNQKKIAGIGNYLRSEILYAAKIDPYKLGKDLSEEEWKRLHDAIIQVLDESYDYHGYSLRDYKLPDESLGTFSPKIYGKKKDPFGNPVVSVTKGNQSVYYAPAVQH